MLCFNDLLAHARSNLNPAIPAPNTADEGFSEEGPMFAGLKCKRYSVFGAEIFHDLRDFVCFVGGFIYFLV